VSPFVAARCRSACDEHHKNNDLENNDLARAPFGAIDDAATLLAGRGVRAQHLTEV
jgi:hypothetical protein